MVEFLMEVSGKDRIDTVRESLAMISAGNDLIIADEMIKELADRSGTSESVLRSELGKMKKKERRHGKKEAVPVKTVRYPEEYLLLSTLISFPEKFEMVMSQLHSEDLRELPVKSLFEKAGALGDGFTVDKLLREATEEEQSIIRELTLDPGFDFAWVDKNIQDCLRRLAQRKLDERRNVLMSQEPNDVTLHDSILKEKRKLIREKKL